jgi:hypothetical protein
VTRGRKPKPDPTVAWSVRIPSTLAAQIDLQILDPIRGAPAYGRRSELVTQLLYLWLRSLQDSAGVDTGKNVGDNSPLSPPSKERTPQ